MIFMNTVSLLLSMPGGSEWLLILIFFAFVIVCPVLAIVYYMEAKRLRQENKMLREKLNKP